MREKIRFGAILLVCLLVGLSIGRATDFTKLVSARLIAVTNASTTNITCPLGGATMIQVYIDPNSTAQIFTITFNDGTTMAVPSGGAYILRTKKNLTANELVFKVQTATGAANLVVYGAAEINQ